VADVHVAERDWRFRGPAEIIGDAVGKATGGRCFAVHHEGPLRQVTLAAQPAEQRVAVSVREQPADRVHAGAHGLFLTKQSHLLLGMDQTLTERSLGPNTDDHDCSFRAAGAVSQVVAGGALMRPASHMPLAALTMPPALGRLSAIDSFNALGEADARALRWPASWWAAPTNMIFIKPPAPESCDRRVRKADVVALGHSKSDATNR